MQDLSLSLLTDTVPFKNVVFRALMPAVTELWNRSQKNSFDAGIYKKYIGTAARYLNQVPLNDSWNPIINGLSSGSDPFE